MKKIILHPKILNIDGESDYNMSSKMSTRALKNGYIEEPVSCNFFFIFKYLTYSLFIVDRQIQNAFSGGEEDI